MAWNLEPVSPTPETPAEINHEQISPQTSSCWGRLFQILTAPFCCCKKKPGSELHSLEHDRTERHQDKIYKGQTNGHTPRALKPKRMKLRNGHTSRTPKPKHMKLRNGRVVQLDSNTHKRKSSIEFTRGDLYTKDSES